jgi:Tol biopolymer transport system component
MPRWSPDGARIRFTLYDTTGFSSLWEVGADGRNLHHLLLNLPGDPPVCCGDWTPDGRYFIVTSRQENIANLWLVQEKSDWLHRIDHRPLPLTVGPISYYRPLPSRDSKTIFAVGTHSWGELLRYDAGRKDFVPFFDGRSADHLEFSRDGQWVTYVAYPEATLWRARSDGSQALQLTFPPLRVGNPRWSPDGKRLLFSARHPGEWVRVYTISSEGGSPELVLPDSHSQTFPTWSASGDAVIFGRDNDVESHSEMALFRHNFASGVTEKIPSSDGLYSPSLSPDGRYLSGTDSDSRMLFVIDLETGRRTQVSKHTADYPCWSADSRYLYYNTLIRPDGRFLLRVRVPGGKEEVIASVPFMATGVYGFWSGLAPDGSPILLRDLSQTNVYSISLTAP